MKKSKQDDLYPIFVGGIRGRDNESSLKEFFSQYGPIRAIKLKKKVARGGNKVNRGFCVIFFETQRASQKVIQASPIDMDGRIVSCRTYLSGSKLDQSIQDKNELKIFLKNLPPQTKNRDISSIFQNFGEIESAYTLSDPKTGFSKGFGFVIFKEKQTLKKALSYKGQLILYGTQITISRYDNEAPFKDADPSPPVRLKGNKDVDNANPEQYEHFGSRESRKLAKKLDKKMLKKFLPVSGREKINFKEQSALDAAISYHNLLPPTKIAYWGIYRLKLRIRDRKHKRDYFYRVNMPGTQIGGPETADVNKHSLQERNLNHFNFNDTARSDPLNGLDTSVSKF